MASKKYDVIVIGSGVGGMGSAALLARDFNQKVLVLEKSPFIGGRTLSFVGKGNKMTVDSQEVDIHGFRQFWEMNSTWAFTASETPTLEEIFKKGLFDGYTMDSGHGLFWGNKSRARCLLDYLGVPVDIPVNTGFAIVDYFKNKAYQVGKGDRYPWMSEEGFTASMNQLRDMATTELAALPKLMNVSLQDWLEARDMHPEAYDYIKNLAGSQTANNVPAITPAGDFLGYQAIARYIKMNLVTGSVGTISQPGITTIPLAMEECLNANGGEVRRSCPVESTIIEQERVKGVIVRTKRGHETIFADKIICNVPPKMIHSVIHPRHFDQEWIGTIQRFWNPGLLSAMIGLKKNIWEEKGIEERSFIYMPGCIRKEEGFESEALSICLVVSGRKRGLRAVPWTLSCGIWFPVPEIALRARAFTISRGEPRRERGISAFHCPCSDTRCEIPRRLSGLPSSAKTGSSAFSHPGKRMLSSGSGHRVTGPMAIGGPWEQNDLMW